MTVFRLDRRALLRGAGGIALGLPFLDAMRSRPAAAAPATSPKRIVFWFTPDGCPPELWIPNSGDPTDSTLLQPLAAYKQDVLAISHLRNRAAYYGPGDAHQRGISSVMTGVPIDPSSRTPGGDGDPKYYTDMLGGGVSLDNYIAGELAKKPGGLTPLASLNLGVRAGSGSPWNYMSFAGQGAPTPSQNDPKDVFATLSKSKPDASNAAAQAAQARAATRQKLVLDAVQDDYKRLSPRLGKDDRQRLDAHVQTIADIESRIGVMSVAGASCHDADVSGSPDPGADDQYPGIGKAQLDLAVMALSCDTTRVVSILWNQSNSPIVHTWKGVDKGHHDVSHSSQDDPTKTPYLTKIYSFYTDQFTYLIDQLKAVPDGDGTLFDNTVIVWVSDFGDGRSHDHNNLPVLIAGRGGGAVAPGRHIVMPDDTPHNNLLVALAQAMDIDTQTFGASDLCTGMLPSLKG